MTVGAACEHSFVNSFRLDAADRSRRGPTRILHADLDAFFASVEQRDDPSLRGRPIAVGGGVVLAASYEARAFGVRGAMGGTEARRRCPDLRFVRPRMSAYSEASAAVFEIFRETSPVVEGISIDEAFLDVSGLRRLAGEPADIATRLRARVRAEVGLPISVGIASTKALAKVASAVGKPDGLCEVPVGGELDFLHPLPIERLWGVGPANSAKLRARGIRTVGELAAVPRTAVASIVGRGSAAHLCALAGNEDPRRVRTRARRRSMGAQRALGRAPRTAEEHDAVLIALAERVTGRMRSADRVGRCITLRVRFADFTAVTRSVTLPEATAHTATILAGVRRAYRHASPLIEERGCTLLGISIGHLDDADAVQLALPFDVYAGDTLDHAVDAVRDKFGAAAVRRAAGLRAGRSVEMPMLPD